MRLPFYLSIMAEDLVEHCSKLSIVNDAEDVIDLDEGKDDTQDDKLSLRLIGRVLIEKPLNFDAFKRTMLHVWCLKDGVLIRALGQNSFMFQFFHWRDKEKVLVAALGVLSSVCLCYKKLIWTFNRLIWFSTPLLFG